MARPAIASALSGDSQNGHQPSASSTARRSERGVRPPIQNGTCACTGVGSSTMPSNAKYSPLVRRRRDRDSATRSAAQRVVGTRTAIVERRVEQRELLLERADAEAEHEPPVADAVERAVPLRDRHRVVVAEHQHVGGEADALGACREIAERRQRVPVAAAAHVDGGFGHGDVLAAGEVVVAEPVGGLGDAGDVVDRAVAFPLGVAARARA